MPWFALMQYNRRKRSDEDILRRLQSPHQPHDAVRQSIAGVLRRATTQHVRRAQHHPHPALPLLAIRLSAQPQALRERFAHLV